MRIPTSETNDTLDAASLPPTEGNELNYRTRPDVEAELPFTSGVLKFALGVAAVVAVVIRFAVPEYLGYAVIGLFGFVWWFVPEATQPEPDRSHPPSEFRIWLFAIWVGCIAVHAAVPTPVAGYLVAFPCAVAALVGLVLVYARQVVAWMAANPKVYGHVGREWRGYFPHAGSWVARVPAGTPAKVSGMAVTSLMASSSCSAPSIRTTACEA